MRDRPDDFHPSLTKAFVPDDFGDHLSIHLINCSIDLLELPDVGDDLIARGDVLQTTNGQHFGECLSQAEIQIKNSIAR